MGIGARGIALPMLSILVLTAQLQAQRQPVKACASNSPATAAASQLPPEPVPQSDTGPCSRQVTLRTLIPNLIHDQKPIYRFPLELVKGQHLWPTLGFAAATAGLVVADPYDEPYFRNSSGFKTYKTGWLRGRNTTLIITMVPLGTYLDGLARKSSSAQSTALFAGEALADTELLSLVLKAMTGREHPSDIPVNGNFRDTWFKWSGTWSNPGTFPSGHSIGAFAVAAVFADRYREHRWVRWAAFGVAAAISLSRIPDQAHFPSDVFAGAVLGYAVAHSVVLRNP